MDEGVGSILVAVAVGCGEAVAVTDGAVVVRRCKQAEKMSSPRRRIAGVFFKRSMDDDPILIRRTVSHVSANQAWKVGMGSGQSNCDGDKIIVKFDL